MTTHYVELPSTGTILAIDTPGNWPEAKQLPHAEGKRRHQAHAKAQLLKLLAPGATVYTVLRHVSRSGMQRRLDLYTIADNKPVYLTSYAATVLDWPHPRDGGKTGLVVNGCGMDMGFHAVHSLSSALFGTGDKYLKHEWL